MHPMKAPCSLWLLMGTALALASPAEAREGLRKWVQFLVSATRLPSPNALRPGKVNKTKN